MSTLLRFQHVYDHHSSVIRTEMSVWQCPDYILFLSQKNNKKLKGLKNVLIFSNLMEQMKTPLIESGPRL